MRLPFRRHRSAFVCASAARACVENLEKRTLLSASLPWGGTPAAVPGTIKAANYDTGGKGVAFNGNANSTDGAAYRADTIGLAFTNDGGGQYFVGWVNPGEWINYTVNVAQTSTYSLDVRAATGSQGGAFHVEADGVNVTGKVVLPGTGGWQNWTDLVVNNVSLSAGQHTLKLVIDSAAQAGWGVGDFETMTL